MKKYNQFQLTLQPVRKNSVGRNIYTVAVTIPNYELGDDLHFNARSARDAYLEAMEFIVGLVNRMCEDCSGVVPESDETFRNCGVCESCYLENHA